MPGYGAPYLGHKVTRPLSVTGYRAPPRKRKGAKKTKRSIYKAGYGDRTGNRKQRKYPRDGSDSLPEPSRRRKSRIPAPPDYQAPSPPRTSNKRPREGGDAYYNRRKTAGDRTEMYMAASQEGGSHALDFNDI